MSQLALFADADAPAAAPPPPVALPPLRVLASAADCRAAMRALAGAPAVGLDTETTDLYPHRGRLRLLTLATDAAVYVVDADRLGRDAWQGLLEVARCYVTHNGAFDLKFLLAAGARPPARVVDTMLAWQLLHLGTEEGRPRRGSLQHCVQRALGVTLDKTLQVSDWSGALTAAQLRYAAADAYLTLRLWRWLEPRLAAEDLQAIAALEFRCLPFMAWLQWAGVHVDEARWQRLHDALRTERERQRRALQADVLQFGAGLVDLDSPQQVLRWLRARGVAVESTDDEVLRPLAAREPLVARLLAYRRAKTLDERYGLGLLRVHGAVGGDPQPWWDPVAQRLYPSYFQIGADSGRMTCRDPNVQQIPREAAYRACFTAAEGCRLVVADYATIEGRLAAVVAEEPRLLRLFQEGVDWHDHTTRILLGREPADAAERRRMRQVSKSANYGLLFGMGVERFRSYAAANYGVELDPREAATIRRRWLAGYPAIAAWHLRQSAAAEDVRTLAGRRRRAVARFTEKLNTPVQGLAADGLKAALARLWERRAECPRAWPVLVVHDEVVFETAAEDAAATAEWLRTHLAEGMAAVVGHRVPIVVEPAVGDSWAVK